MKVHHYYSNSGKNLILDYIYSLTTSELLLSQKPPMNRRADLSFRFIDEQVDAFSVLECLEKNEMDKIKFKRWEKKIYEVYFYKHNRIFYIIADGDNMYLLHACKKQKNQTEKTDKKIVIKRAKEIGKAVGKDFI